MMNGVIFCPYSFSEAKQTNRANLIKRLASVKYNWHYLIALYIKGMGQIGKTKLPKYPMKNQSIKLNKKNVRGKVNIVLWLGRIWRS